MKETIINYIIKCSIWQWIKYYNPLILIETPSKPFKLVQMDTFTYNTRNFLILVDWFSKFAQAILILTAICIANTLTKYFTCFGTPLKIIVDGGKELNNVTITKLLNVHKIKVHFTIPSHRKSNNFLERFHSPHYNRTSNYAVIGYNSSIGNSTDFTPLSPQQKLVSGINSQISLLKEPTK